MASSSFYFVTLLLLASRFSEAALRTYNLTFHSGTKAPDGFSREVYLINGQQPGPLIEVDEGDELLVFVQNDLSVESTIHWHGLLQRGTPEMDGVPGVTQYPIHPGGNFTYKFSVPDQYGFYWYHSHFRTYYDDAIRGALMVHPSPTRPRPFEELAKNSDELKTMLQVERDAASVMLNDWTHELSNKIASRYLETGAFPHCVDSILANGFGRVECLPDYILEAGTDLGLDMPYMGNGGPPAMSSDISSMSMSVLKKRTDTSGPSMSMDMTMAERTMTHMSPTKNSMQTTSLSPMSSMESMPTSMPSMSSMVSMSGMGMSGMGPMSDTPGTIPLNARGCTPPMMFREGYNISSLPQATCSNTTSPLLTIPADPMRGWIALNLVNSGAVSGLAVSLDAHSMYVYAADGLYVTMQEIKVLYLSIGQRYSVMIKLDQSPGDYFLRYASYPTGDMQQVLEGQAIVSYKMNATMPRRTIEARHDPTSLWMLKNGTATMNSSALDTKLLSPFTGNLPPLGMADTTKIFNISQTGIVTWVMDGDRVYEESAVPILSGNSSAGWTANTTFRFPSNQTVDIIMSIADDSMDMMGHPIHLHGHKFWVLGSGKGLFKYSSASAAPPSMINLRNPAYRDTADLPMAGWLVIRYVTDNPGAWLFHCHIQWHLESGMALVMVEGEDMLPNIIAASNVTSGSKGPDSNLGASNDARGRDVAYLSVPSLVLCGAMALAAFF